MSDDIVGPNYILHVTCDDPNRIDSVKTQFEEALLKPNRCAVVVTPPNVHVSVLSLPPDESGCDGGDDFDGEEEEEIVDESDNDVI